MKINAVTVVTLLGLSLLMSGCASAQVFNLADAHVRLAEDGRLYVGKVETPAHKLAAQLKKQGIGPKTQITIEIPPNTPPQALTVISRELASNGYSRILFSKPRKATAVKGEDPLLKDLR
jgi:hypothetical protein